MDFAAYYRRNITYLEYDDPRLIRITQIVKGLAPRQLLDVGCGSGWLADNLRRTVGSHLVGVDVLTRVVTHDWDYVCADMTAGLPFRDGSFDCVVAGEVIEHVPCPDNLLREARRVLRPAGHLVVSTPNLVSWANRILVPFGVQPLGTETSTEVALGRRFLALGQGSQVQGHLKVFTHRSLEEILRRYGFDVVTREGMTAAFPGPFATVDRFFARFVPLASDLIYVARALDNPAPPAPPRPHDPRGIRYRPRA